MPHGLGGGGKRQGGLGGGEGGPRRGQGEDAGPGIVGPAGAEASPERPGGRAAGPTSWHQVRHRSASCCAVGCFRDRERLALEEQGARGLGWLPSSPHPAAAHAWAQAAPAALGRPPGLLCCCSGRAGRQSFHCRKASGCSQPRGAPLLPRCQRPGRGGRSPLGLPCSGGHLTPRAHEPLTPPTPHRNVCLLSTCFYPLPPRSTGGRAGQGQGCVAALLASRL